MQPGGQFNTRRESLTHVHHLLTHLAHLYSRNGTHTHKGTLLALESDSVGNRSLLHLYLRSETAFCGVIKKLLTFTGGGGIRLATMH